MRGEFIGVWDDTISEIWAPLAALDGAPDDLYCELFRALSSAFKVPLSTERLADIVDDPFEAKGAFLALKATSFLNEQRLAAAMELVREALDDLAGPVLSDPYFNFLSAFIERFSLRYDLRFPCILCPTLPGIFSSLIRDLKEITRADAHLSGLMTDFESAIRDLRTNSSDGHMKTCIQKQINLLEGMGATLPLVTGNTLGVMCNQAGTWPHAKVKESIKELYAFACDYPGIRHGGTAANKLRELELKDVMAMSILLAGFVPYLTDSLDFETLYGASHV